MYARVVFPLPAGPHRMIEGSRPASASTVSGLPGPIRWRCPATSSKERGRIRAASGVSAMSVPTLGEAVDEGWLARGQKGGPGLIPFIAYPPGQQVGCPPGRLER